MNVTKSNKSISILSSDSSSEKEDKNILLSVIFMKTKLKETDSTMNFTNININPYEFDFNKLIRIVSNSFNQSSDLTFYNFHGREILDSSDLKYLEDNNEFFKVIFFNVKGQSFNIDLYRLKCFYMIEKIGEGGFGKVYLAEDVFQKRKFAIKYLKLSYSVDMKYIYQEVEALRKLNHKNIIKLYSYSLLNHDRISLILEYGMGGTLMNLLSEKGRLDENNAREIFNQIVKAIYCCHNNQIIHRDLKPENILFLDKEHSQVKVIDFGIAGLFKGEIIKAGSLSYMPPEVLSGMNYESHPCIDIWSLGCVLYEMIVGEKIFKGSADEKKEKIINCKYSIPKSTMSIEAEDLISKILIKQANKRILLKDLMNHPWVLNKKLEKNIWEEKIIEEERNLTEMNRENEVGLTHRSNKVNGISFKVRNTLLNNKDSKSKAKSSKELNELKQIQSGEKEFNFYNYLRDNHIKSEKKKKNVSGLITKVNYTKDINLLDMNSNQLKSVGKFVSYFQPIGYTKTQKDEDEKIKDYLTRNNKDHKENKTQKDKFPVLNSKNMRNSISMNMKDRKESVNMHFDENHKEININSHTLKNFHKNEFHLQISNKKSLVKGVLKSSKSIRNSIKSPEDLRKYNESIGKENFNSSHGFYTMRSGRNEKESYLLNK